MHIRATSFTFLQFPVGLNIDPLRHNLDEYLILGELAPIELSRMKPIGPLEFTSSGFVDVIPGELTAPIRGNGFDGLLLAFGETQKIIPASAVNEVWDARLKEIEEREGRRLGGRERKRVKDDLLHELLPRAFTKTSRTFAFIFPDRGLLAVGSATARAVDGVVSEIRSVLGSFPALPVNAEVAPRQVLTGWVDGSGTLEEFDLSLGAGAKLVDPVEGGASVTLKDQELICDEVEKHLEAGKQVKSLDLVHGDRSRFTLGEDLVLRKFRVDEAVKDEFYERDDEDVEAAFQIATMTILAAELLPLFDIMAKAFRLTSAPEA